MEINSKTYSNMYRDSVSLMQLSSNLMKLDGISQASAVMATQANLQLLDEANLTKGENKVNPNDILIVIEGNNAESINAAFDLVEADLNKTFEEEDKGSNKIDPKSIQMGVEFDSQANLALISAPGEYAAAEALKALQLGLNVMLFSDNISKKDEITLKEKSKELGLLMMGPDCGSAIINGIPLAFANVIRPGNIGIIAASGTGLQQVSCLIDNLGGGITQAIGTGGHDLSQDIGGTTMLQSIALLADDDSTDVIVLISKPPASSVAKKLIEVASQANKPVVVNFLGLDAEYETPENVYFVKSLENAAFVSYALSINETPNLTERSLDNKYLPLAKQAASTLAENQHYIRGLYSGGTFCYEATILLGEMLKSVYSNTPINNALALPDVWQSIDHTLLDLGDDVFTRGRPHPMIDHRLRNERILEEAAKEETAVILLDVVLGYGSHDNPGDEIAPIIVEAQKVAEQANRKIAFVGFICGTDKDPQNIKAQEKILAEAGILLATSNAQAVLLAAKIVEENNT
ncbi:MAG: acyl-CoA synthetase FdrA [Chloroflexota bacterium]